MSRTSRLLELMILVRTHGRFTVQEMAAEMGVSRRTMLRDLQALSEMGVPLAASPGPGGGYSLIASARMLPLTLTVDEAIGLVISYESFLRHADTPFAEMDVSAITKLRNAMPGDTVARLDRVHACIALLSPDRMYRAPHLDALLGAAVDAVHLRITYESRARRSERLIFPLGLYAADGYWYVACYDYPRAIVLALRADRIDSVERVPGLAPPTEWCLRDYLARYRTGATDMVPLRARVGRQVAFGYDFQALFGEIELRDDGDGFLDTWIPFSEIDFYASRLLALGPGIRVESPPELIAAMLEVAAAVVNLYPSESRDAQQPEQTVPASY